MFGNRCYERLSEYIKMQSTGEMKHAEALMERILFLDESPSVKPLQLSVGKNVREMLQSDDLEVGAPRDYNIAIQIAVEEKDKGSRDLFLQLLKDEESHVDGWKRRLIRSRNSESADGREGRRGVAGRARRADCWNFPEHLR